MESDGRKHPVHKPAHERFNVPVIVFLTVCTKDRKPILANAAAHDNIHRAWTEATSWLVGRYVVMPDHLHLFCAPAEIHPQALARWVAFWKSHSARNWPVRKQSPIWQRHFWDTQLRRGESYDAKWDYVVENPRRARLISQTQDWPYQGELNVLRW